MNIILQSENFIYNKKINSPAHELFARNVVKQNLSRIKDAEFMIKIKSIKKGGIMKGSLFFIGMACIMALTLKPDHTSQKPPNFGLQQKDSLYYLIGKRGDFEALRFALASPGDITPNQVTALSNWIAGARLIQDTTAKKDSTKSLH